MRKKILITAVVLCCLLSGCGFGTHGPSYDSSVAGDEKPEKEHADNSAEDMSTEQNTSAEEGVALHELPMQTPAAQRKGYSLKVGDTVIKNILLPESYVVDAHDDIIQMQTDELRVIYSDSHIDDLQDIPSDKEALKKEFDDIAGTWNVTPDMYTFEKDDVTGYAIAWKTDECNCLRIYQPVQAKTFLRININDYQKKYDNGYLIDAYWLDLDDDEEPYKREKELVPYNRDRNDSLSLEIGGVRFDALPIPDFWLTDVSDLLIQTEPETDITVTYADSYIDVNDMDSIMNEKRSIEEVNAVPVDLDAFVYKGKTGYILSWEYNDWRTVRLFQPVGTASTYLKVNITDYTKTNSAWGLANRYAIGIE